MDTQKMIDALNKAVALEHTAVMQYKQHALLVSGLWRKEYEGFFSGQSESALGHAHKFGQKVVIRRSSWGRQFASRPTSKRC